MIFNNKVLSIYILANYYMNHMLCKGMKNSLSAVKKVFSGVGISFKGDGFYKNDHGSSSKKPGASPTEKTNKEKSSDTTDKSSNASSESSSNAKSSSKPSTSADSGSK